MSRQVRGILFLDYVRMLRRYKVADRARAHLRPEEAHLLTDRLDPAAWYPMDTFERLGLAILEEIVLLEVDVIRLWGRSSLPTLLAFFPPLAAAAGPREAVGVLSGFIQSLFDFSCLSVERVDDVSASVFANYGMSPAAEEAAVRQTIGFFEELITTHGGGAVQSELGGHRFTLRWSPRADAPLPLLVHPRVLVVDDERLVLAALKRALGRVAAVTATESMPEALRALEQQPFDAVLADHAMGPAGTGLDLLLEVGRRWPGVRRILHSGNPPEAARSLLAQGLLHEVLTKPAPFDVLLQAIASRA